MRIVLITIAAILFYSVDAKEIAVTATAEFGFLSVIDHKLQFSENGTYLDYKSDAGQDVLYPISRWSLDAKFNERHSATLLYQPLLIESEEQLSRDLLIDNQLFPAGTPVRFTYGFPFWRELALRLQSRP